MNKNSIAMRMAFPRLAVASIFLVLQASVQGQYEPNWKSLDSRTNPSWYDEGKFGIFMHWGAYSVPSYGGGGSAAEWFWKYWHDQEKPFVEFMEKNYPPGFSYADFGAQFKAELFNPDEWADLLAKSGAKYYVLTSKHHEGWTNWRSAQSWNWNSVDNGPHRDLVGELAQSVRNRTKIKFGLYFSLFEWFHPLYLQDKASGFKTQTYVDEIMLPQLYDLVNTYKPEYVWSDGDWEAPDTYFKSTQFLAWLFNSSPVKDTVLVNDRWGSNCACKHGSVYTCQDRYQPGKRLNHKWENAMTVDKFSWGYRREAKIQDMLNMTQLLELFVSTVSFGGNMLMNVGPRSDGTIDPFFQERLTQMGQWLSVNGEAIYSSIPWIYANETHTRVWYTARGEFVYATCFDWPQNGVLHLEKPTPTQTTMVTLLGLGTTLTWAPAQPSGMTITVPAMAVNQLPTPWAWVLKLSNLKSLTHEIHY